MRKIVEYTIVTRDDTPTFMEVMNYMIKNGWQPLGGLAIEHSLSGSSPNFKFKTSPFQAMVKYESPKGEKK